MAWIYLTLHSPIEYFYMHKKAYKHHYHHMKEATLNQSVSPDN
jgi:hypothetical protein